MGQVESIEARVANATSTDPRVLRTRRMLRDAVLTLGAERDFADITIADLTRLAEVNRATFYQHYRDKNDLIVQALDDLFDEFTTFDEVYNHAAGLAATEVPTAFVIIFERLNQRRELFRRLLGDDGSTAFARRYRIFFEEQFLRTWADLGRPSRPGDPPPELLARAAAAEGQGVIAWCLENGRDDSPETMASWLWQFCCNRLGFAKLD